jgi:hypothetical protein
MSDLLDLEAAALGPIVIRSPPIYISGANDEILALLAPAQTDGVRPGRSRSV